MKTAIAVVAVVLVLVAAASAHAQQHAAPDPPSFSTAVHALITDQAKIDADVHQEQRDARAGPTGPGEPGCYNLVNNVDDDAVDTIGDFAANTVVNDRNNLQDAINQLRADVIDFNADIADFINDGVPRPSGATGTITDISDKIQLAISQANAAIKAMNGYVSRAYRIGAKLAARGHCASSDTPQSHLSQPYIQPVS